MRGRLVPAGCRGSCRLHQDDAHLGRRSRRSDPLTNRRACKLNRLDPLPPPSAALLEGAALFLDFDGTLVELAERPDAIHVPDDLRSLLGRLASRLGGRIGILSGRALQDLERWMDLSGVAFSGSHGLELRLPNGRIRPAPRPPGLEEARQAAARIAAETPGLLLEEKPASIALHYRQAPERAQEVEAAMAELAARTGLVLQRGKLVAELRPCGATKGDALRALMKEPEFAGARPLFVGDDLTDEDGFAAAAAIGGGGILVGPARTTAASWRLNDVEAVRRWLVEAAPA